MAWKIVRAFVFVCVCGACPTTAYTQAANDTILRDEAVDSMADGVVAEVMNGAEAVAKGSARAVIAEAHRDVAAVESAVRSQRTPTPVADSDQAIEQDIDKLESLSQE